MSRIRQFLGLEPNILAMLIAILVVGLGEELWMRFIPKYLEFFNATPWVIASYGTLRDLFDALYQYPGGWLADRFGRKRSLLFFMLSAAVGYCLYLLSEGWLGILIGTMFVMGWSSLSSPAIFAVIGDHLPPTKRSIGFGVQSIIKRLPIIIAPGIGGWLILSQGLQQGLRLGFMLTILCSVLSMIVMIKLYREEFLVSPDKVQLVHLWGEMDPRLKRLLLSDCLARWAEGIPNVFIILFVMNIAHATAFEFGWLIAIQMTASIVFYIPMAKLADRFNRKPFILLTFAFFSLYPFMLVQSPALGWIIVAFVAGGLREIGEPARKALIVDLGRPSARGRGVGLYYLIRGLAVLPASLIGGLLWSYDARWPFYAAFAIGLIGLLLYAFIGPRDTKNLAVT